MSKEESKTYISNTIEVDSTSPAEIDILKQLGMHANAGWITSDDGSIQVRLNGRGAPRIPMEVDDTIDFKKKDNWRLKRCYISTPSIISLTVRYMLYNTDVKGIGS